MSEVPPRWRTGRKLGRMIYRQDGAEPSDNDAFLGLMESATLAEWVVEAHNRFVDGEVGAAARNREEEE